MSNNRLISKSFYTNPSNGVINFKDPQVREKISKNESLNAFFTISNGNYVYTYYNPGELSPENDSLLKDVNRGLTCNNTNYHRAYLFHAKNYIKKFFYGHDKKQRDADIGSFIKETLDISDDEFSALKAFYIQPVAQSFLSNIFSCVFNLELKCKKPTDDEIKSIYFNATKNAKINLYKGDDSKVYLEVASPLIFQSMDGNDEKIGYIPCTVAYQFVLTDQGFRLDTLAVSNESFIDLCLNETISPEMFWNHLLPMPISLWEQSRRLVAVGIGIAILTAGLVAFGIATAGLGPLIVAGVSAAAGVIAAATGITITLSTTAALVVGSAAIVAAAVTSYAALVGTAIGISVAAETLWKKLTGKAPAKAPTPEITPISSTDKDLIKAFNSGNAVQPAPLRSRNNSATQAIPIPSLDKKNDIVKPSPVVGSDNKENREDTDHHNNITQPTFS